MSATRMADAKPKTGGCLCGGVRYAVSDTLRDVIYCHCGQCRRTSGHFVAATAVQPEGLTLIESVHLEWYRSSASAERGFCRRCGSSLFWRPRSSSHISIMAGTLDGPTGLRARSHIYLDAAGDYYTLGDGLPQYAGCEP